MNRKEFLKCLVAPIVIIPFLGTTNRVSRKENIYYGNPPSTTKEFNSKSIRMVNVMGRLFEPIDMRGKHCDIYNCTFYVEDIKGDWMLTDENTTGHLINCMILGSNTIYAGNKNFKVMGNAAFKEV